MPLIVITISDEPNGNIELALKSSSAAPSNPPTQAEIVAARMINAITDELKKSDEPNRIQLLS